MSGAILCDLAPVSAPLSGLRRSSEPGQVLRVGPLYDAVSGEFLFEVTDQMCADMAETANALGFPVPIDLGHALYLEQVKAQSEARGMGEVTMYGRAVPGTFEARPGDGLYAFAEYNESGAAFVEANPGAVFWSPSLLGGKAFHPQTGKPMPGRRIHSLSFTPTPRQDSTKPLALQSDLTGALPPSQKGMPMSGTVGAPAPNQGDSVLLAQRLQSAETDLKAERDSVVMLQTQLAAVTAERDAAKGEAQAKGDEAVTLSQRLESLEKDKAARDFRDLCAQHEGRGVVLTAEMRAALAPLPAVTQAVLLAQMPATRPTQRVGEGGAGQPLSDEMKKARIVKLAREKYNGDLAAAAQEVG